MRALADATVIAGLRLGGLTAPAVFDGPIDTPSFLAYLDQVLVPTLRPGEVVVLDNLIIHKQPGVREAIERVGATVQYLPPYSPDLNPIEQAWSCSHSDVRNAACRATSRSADRKPSSVFLELICRRPLASSSSDVQYTDELPGVIHTEEHQIDMRSSAVAQDPNRSVSVGALGGNRTPLGRLMERQYGALETVEPCRALGRRPAYHPQVQRFELGFRSPRDVNAVCHVCGGAD